MTRKRNVTRKWPRPLTVLRWSLLVLLGLGMAYFWVSGKDACLRFPRAAECFVRPR